MDLLLQNTFQNFSKQFNLLVIYSVFCSKLIVFLFIELRSKFGSGWICIIVLITIVTYLDMASKIYYCNDDENFLRHSLIRCLWIVTWYTWPNTGDKSELGKT